MRSIKDIYKKIRDYSITSAIISFISLLIWFVYALSTNKIKPGREVGGVIDDTTTLVFFWVIVIFLLSAIVTAFIMHVLLEKRGSLVTADEYKRNLELMREREILKAESEQAKIESTDKVKRKNTVIPAVKEFFSKTTENVKDFYSKTLSKIKEGSESRAEKREIRKQEKLEQKEAREAELARMREAERVEEEKRLIEEQKRLEEERKNKEIRLAEEQKRKEAEEALRLEQEEVERLRQEKLDRQKAIAEKKAKEAEQARFEAEMAEQAKKAQEKKEQELFEREQADKKAKEEADKKAKEEAEKAAMEAEKAKKADVVIEKPKKKPSKPKIITKTKTDFIDIIFDTTGISKNKANKFLKYFAEVVKDALVERQDVDLPEIGTFTTIEMPAKDAVNPQTNEAIVVPAHHQVRFRVSDEFRDKINEIK